MLTKTRIAMLLLLAAFAGSSLASAQAPALGAPSAPAPRAEPSAKVEDDLAEEPSEARGTPSGQIPGVEPAATQAPVSLTAPYTPPRQLVVPVKPAQSSVALAAEPPKRGPVRHPPDNSPWRPGSLTAGLTASGLLRTDPFYDLFAESDVWAQFGAFVGYDTRLSDPLRVGGELSWGLAQADRRRTGEDFDLSLTEHRVLASALLMTPLTEALWPHVRIGAGAAMSKVHVELDQSQFLIDQWRVVPQLELALGATYHVPIKSRERSIALAVGMRVEVGYAVTGTRELNQDQSTDQHVKTRYAELGSIRPGGPFARLAVLLRI